MIHMFKSCSLFAYFFLRDCYVYMRYFKNYFINFILINPCISGLTFLYLQPQANFTRGNIHLYSIIFTGNILLLMMVITYKVAIKIFFDLQHQKYILYQASITSTRLIIMQRILFNSMFSWLIIAPAYPLINWYFPGYLDTSQTSWRSFLFMLYCGTLFCAAYHTCTALMLRSPHDIRRLWIRYNQPLFLFGGFSVPWHIIATYSSILGYITRFNPMMYITEGIRQSFFNSALFFPYYQCVVVLIIGAIICSYTACVLLQKKEDLI